MWHQWTQIAPGIVFGTGLFAIYGIGLGALLKNQIVAVVTGLGFTLVIEAIIGAIWPTVGEYLPGQAAMALENAKATVGLGPRQPAAVVGRCGACSWSTASSWRSWAR